VCERDASRLVNAVNSGTLSLKKVGVALVVDANVVISALVADSTTRELIVTLEPPLLTPAVIHQEIDRHRPTIVDKSGMDAARVEQLLDLLFQYIETAPATEFHQCIDRADDAIGAVDPDDVLYLACALARDAAIWSDDADFSEQELVAVYGTSEVVAAFDTS
jgi:predicted nucleic acid-binding protein